MPPLDQPVGNRRSLSRRAKVLMCLGLALLILATLYMFEASRYYRALPTPIVDAYAEFNARNDGFTEEQKAWTVYYDVRHNHWPDATESIEDKKHAITAAERARVIDDPFYEFKDPFTSGHNQFGIPPEHPLYADVLALAHDFRPQLERLREAAARPVFGTPITDNINQSSEFTPDWFATPPTQDPTKRESIIGLNMPGIGTAKAVANMLDFDAQIAADEGDAQRSADNLLALFRMARQTAGEPTSIGQLIALAIQRIGIDRLLHLLEQGVVSEYPEPYLDLIPELIQLRNQPIRIHPEDIRLTMLDWAGHFYTDDGTGNGYLTPGGLAHVDSINTQGNIPRWAIALAWPLRSLAMDRAEAIEHIATAVVALSDYQNAGPAGHPAFGDAMAPIIEAEVTNRQPVTKIYTMMSAWEAMIRTESLIQTQLETTIARLALEHHLVETGTFPETLADLVPVYLDRVPGDPFDPGQPLKYRLIDGNPHLYSVGADGDDDHGARPDSEKALKHVRYFEYRFPGPNQPTEPAPDADWVIYQPNP